MAHIAWQTPPPSSPRKCSLPSPFKESSELSVRGELSFQASGLRITWLGLLGQMGWLMKVLWLPWWLCVHGVNQPASSCLHSLCAIGVAQGTCLVVKLCWYGAEGRSWTQLLTERLLQQWGSSDGPETSKSSSPALQKCKVLAPSWSLGCRQTGALLEKTSWVRIAGAVMSRHGKEAMLGNTRVSA